MRSLRPTPRDVAAYYQSSQWLYRLFCYNRVTLSMHYGFWESGTKSRQQAMMQENDAVIFYGNIRKGMHVLDAGCGVGGTAIHIAKQTGAQVVGITLDPAQVHEAQRNARTHTVGHVVDVAVMDFERMTFPDATFDIVYAVESIVYAKNKSLFLNEAYRVLKPGGRLVIADGYASRLPKTAEEQVIYKNLQWGFCLPPVITGDTMTREIQSVGFIRVQKILKTKETWPSVRYFGRLANLVMPVAKILSFVPNPYIQAIYRNAVALTAVKRSYELGLGEYAIHVGVKPRM